MRGYPKYAATKQDYINLLGMAEYRQQALADLLVIIDYMDDQNPNPLYKQKGFGTRQEAIDLIGQYSTKKEIQALRKARQDELRRDLLARELTDDIELCPKAKFQGLRLHTIGEYAHSLIFSQDDDLFINNEGCINQDPDRFVAVQTDDNYFKFVPGHEFSSRLYRGQRKYPYCYSLRCRKEYNDIDNIKNDIRKEEFILLMKRHPILIRVQKIKITDLYFQTDFEGLAQHYGFRTRYLDVTRSRDIAMFFMTCTYDDNEDIYKPYTGNRKGVLYTIDLSQGLINNDKRINIVGLQALPRPGIQRAFSISLGDNENFDDLPYVQSEEFDITRELSEKYFNKFNGGKDLFIKDTMWDKAKQIRCCDSLSKDAFTIYCQKQGIDQKRKEKELLKCDIKFRDYNIKFAKKEILSIKEESKRVKFRTSARFVADPLVINEWPDSQQCVCCVHAVIVLEESSTYSCNRNCIASSQECKENRKEANKEN